jgi:predicted ATPase/DNA-binding CsgD family transcriptional regulator
VAGGVHGFPAALTSFVGRGGAVGEVAGLLAEHRLVTVAGPGGAGKTRLAGEVAAAVADRFEDGVWLAELAAVRDPAQVAVVVAAALGVRDLPSVAVADALAHALARRHMLLVLDNCEQVIGAAAELCGRLLLGADDVRVLATSREPLRIAGEVRYRLGPLTLPEPDDPAAASRSEAVRLFEDRARRVDPGFVLDEKTGATVSRLVTRLDGMPLAIELAAARVDVLGVRQLLDRIDDRFGLLIDGDRLADGRQRSLAAAVQWSYQLLDEEGQWAFRALSVFPGPFTLEAAEAVAGTGASLAVLRLVDSSLLVPPREDPDGRSRYLMLETLRSYGAGLLAAAGESERAEAALARFAAEVAEEAMLGLYTRTWELAGIRHFDAEEITLQHALAWALEHDPGTALRLALAQVSWWGLRGRLISRAPLLAAAVEHAEVGSDEWSAAWLTLGQAALQSGDPAGALEHFTAVRDALTDPGRPESPAKVVLLALCLGGRSSALLYMDRVAEGASDARRVLELAEELGAGGLQAVALACMSVAAWHTGDRDGAIRLARQAQQITDEYAGAMDRVLSQLLAMVLIEADDLAAAERICADGLAACRAVGDLGNLSAHLRNMAVLEVRTGRAEEAAAHLREQLQIVTRAGVRVGVLSGLDTCGELCMATGRPAEAVTVWAAMAALAGPMPLPIGARLTGRREEPLRKLGQQLGPIRTRAAEQRGAAMSLATATEYALMLAAAPLTAANGSAANGSALDASALDGSALDTAALDASAGAAAGVSAGGSGAVPADEGLVKLSPRERELVTLVARGRTDAQIAAQMYISVRTVSTHLDRIRDKTGCRRRADLTRLALSSGLV